MTLRLGWGAKTELGPKAERDTTALDCWLSQAPVVVTEAKRRGLFRIRLQVRGEEMFRLAHFHLLT